MKNNPTPSREWRGGVAGRLFSQAGSTAGRVGTDDDARTTAAGIGEAGPTLQSIDRAAVKEDGESRRWPGGQEGTIHAAVRPPAVHEPKQEPAVSANEMATQRAGHGFGEVKVRVTQAEIDTAIPKNSGHCMKKRYIYFTPVVAQRALLQFDQNIKPTEFAFRLPDPGTETLFPR